MMMMILRFLSGLSNVSRGPDERRRRRRLCEREMNERRLELSKSARFRRRRSLFAAGHWASSGGISPGAHR